MKSSLITEIKLILKGGFYSFFSRLRKRFNKKLFDFGEARKNKKILNEVSKLGDLKDYEIGSTNWLKICEIEMGGFVRDVPRNKVSVLDPRSVRQLQTGGMTGGDRMIHHGYSNYYSKYLKRFLEEENNLVVILKYQSLS